MQENKKKNKNKKYYYYKYHQNKNYYYKKKKKNLIKENSEIDNILLTNCDIPKQIVVEEDISPIKKCESKKRLSLKTVLSISFACIFVLVAIIKTSYSYFTYQNNENHADISVGEMYVKLVDTSSNISLSNIYPKTIEEARNSNDNYFDFSIKAKNTSSTNVILYNININNGSSIEGLERIDPRYIKVDLEEEVDGRFYKIVDAVTLNEYIFNTTIPVNTNNEIIRHYRLRLWISDNVIISDDDPNKSYTQTEYSNLYANFNISINAYDEKQ